MSEGLDVIWCPVSKITTKSASLDFDEEWARKGRQENFKIAPQITGFHLSQRWLKYCIYDVKLYSTNDPLDFP